MSNTHYRTLSVLIMSLVVCVFLIQSASKSKLQAPAFNKAQAAWTTFASLYNSTTGSEPQKIAASACNVSLVNGGNYVLATPSACKGVRVASMTISVSAKTCAESTSADFRSIAHSTLFNGDFGFYLGQDSPVRCLVVQEMRGRTI